MTDFDIFLKAPLDASDREMAEYLDSACEGDADLRARVMALLEEDGRPGEFMSQLPVSPTDPSDLDGTEIGNYKLLEKIGEGGFGVVYMTDQLAPVKRRVALKIIKLGMDTKQVVARFEAERQALAMMDHPNIAKIHDAGVTETGRPYFVMELVKGVPLTEFCDLNQLSSRRRLELFVTVCRAVQHAHQKGVIHRDLKPRNVMVTLHDNKPVPKIIDFGVAKAIGQPLTEKTMFTSHGQMIGTPAYMSPEQAQMSGLDVDTRSDVYSLGVLLYELLTGSPPLDAQRVRSSAYAEVQRLIAEEEAPKPSIRLTTLGEQQATIAKHRDTDVKRLQQYLRGDLDWIVMKALEKERNRRYATADNFAEDVERFLNDDEVHARPPSTAYRLGKLAKKHKGSLSAAVAVAAALIIGSVVSVWSAFEARESSENAQKAQKEEQHQRRAAEQALGQAEVAEKDAKEAAERNRRLLYAANMQSADRLWASPNGNQREVERMLASWIPLNESEEDLRDFTWRYQWSRLHASTDVMDLEATSIAVSPSGNLLTTNARGIHERLPEGRITLWPGDASKAILSPDGKRAAIPKRSHIQLIDLATRTSLSELPGKLFNFSPNGAYILCWDKDRSGVWEATTGKRAYSLDHCAEAIQSKTSAAVFLSPAGRSVILRSYPGIGPISTYLHQVADPVIWTPRGGILICGWSQDGALMASGASSGMVYLHRRQDPGWEQRLEFMSYGKSIVSMAFTADSSQMATGGDNGSIDLWDVSGVQRLEKPKLIRTIKAHVASVETLTFSQDGSRLASLDSTGLAKLWDLTNLADYSSYKVQDMHEDSYSGRIAVDIGRDDEGYFIDDFDSRDPEDEVRAQLNQGERLLALTDPHYGTIPNLSSKSYSEVLTLISGQPGSTVNFHVGALGKPIRVVPLKRTQYFGSRSACVAFSPDGESLAIADTVIGATRWSPNTATTNRRFPALGISVAYDPVNPFLAMVARNEVLLWDLQNDQLHVRLDAELQARPATNNESGGTLAYSPDGQFLAMGTGYPYSARERVQCSELKVWDVATQKQIGGGPLFENNSCLSAVAFTDDGKWLVAADHEGEIRMWDTSSWQLERQFTIGVKILVMALAPTKIALGTSVQGSVKADAVTLWEFETGKLERVFDGPGASGLAFSKGGRTLVSGCWDNSVQLWDVESGMPLRSFSSHEGSIFGVDFSPDGNTLASVGTKGFLNLYKALPMDEIDQHPLTLRAIADHGLTYPAPWRYKEGEKVLRKVYAKQQATLSRDHPDLLRTRAGIRSALEWQQRFPIIAEQPKAVRVPLGESATFRVEIESEGLWSYQWYHNGAPIPESDQPSHRVAQVTTKDLGVYHVEVNLYPVDPLVDNIRSHSVTLTEPGNHPQTEGKLSCEVYHDLPGRMISELEAADIFPNQPNDVREINSWEIPTNAGDHYGMRIRGYVLAPFTGDYRFFLCSDDDSELYLSSDENPDNKKLIAYVHRTPEERRWEELDPEEISEPIRLQAGKRYWAETLFKERSGGDHLAVTWQMPGQLPPQNGDPPIPGEFLDPMP